VLIDAAIGAISVFLAYRLRFDRHTLSEFFGAAERAAVLAAVLVPVTGLLSGLYRPPHRLWPIKLILSVALAFTLAGFITWAWTGFGGVSRFAFFAAAVLTVLIGGAWRAVEGLSAHFQVARRPLAEGLFDDRGAAAAPLGLGLLRLLKYRELLRNLVLKDLKLKYRGSVLGFAWSLANPLVMLLVYWLAFTYILGVRRQSFVLFLLVGMLAWTFFATTIGMSTGTIADAGGLLKSVRFPRTVMPIATVLFNLVQYLMTFGVLLPILLGIFHVAPAWPMLSYPLILLLLVLFTSGVALIVATATAYFRDVKHLVEISLQALFWVTPIVYDLADVPERLRLPILLSPMSPFITAMHDMFVRQAWPDLTVWMAAAAWSVTVFVGGLTIFLSFEDRFAEQL
jgi:ABC-2 type transport system permease protein